MNEEYFLNIMKSIITFDFPWLKNIILWGKFDSKKQEEFKANFLSSLLYVGKVKAENDSRETETECISNKIYLEAVHRWNPISISNCDKLKLSAFN